MNNIILNQLNLFDGKVIYNQFNIDFDIPLDQQIYELEEDLLQIDYGDYLIDVGWYPSLDPKGRLIIYIIRNEDWDEPLLKKIVRGKEIKLFPKYLQEAIDLLIKLREKNEH